MDAGGGSGDGVSVPKAVVGEEAGGADVLAGWPTVAVAVNTVVRLEDGVLVLVSGDGLGDVASVFAIPQGVLTTNTKTSVMTMKTAMPQVTIFSTLKGLVLRPLCRVGFARVGRFDLPERGGDDGGFRGGFEPNTLPHMVRAKLISASIIILVKSIAGDEFMVLPHVA